MMEKTYIGIYSMSFALILGGMYFFETHQGFLSTLMIGWGIFVVAITDALIRKGG